MVTSARSESDKSKWCSGFPKMNPGSYSPPWSRIILRSFGADLLIVFTIEMTPRPPRPQNRIFPGFPGCSTESKLNWLPHCQTLGTYRIDNSWKWLRSNNFWVAVINSGRNAGRTYWGREITGNHKKITGKVLRPCFIIVGQFLCDFILWKP